MIKLKPCPFCGSTDVNILSFLTAPVYFVSCKRCQACGPSRQTEEAAAYIWNKCNGRKEKEND